MASLDYYRKLHPDKADSEIVLEYARVTGTTPYLAAYDLGADPMQFQHDPGKGPLRAGLSSGVDALQGMGWSALGAGADALGLDSARDYFNRAAVENEIEGYFSGRPDLEKIEDQTLGSAVDYGLYQIAKQAPMIGAAVGSTFIPIPGTTLATTGAMARGLAAVPRIAGGGGLRAGMSFAERRAALEAGAQFGSDVARATTSMYPMGVGSLYQESVDAGDPDAWGALTGGIPYAASEALMPAWLRGSLGRTGGRFTGGLPARMGKSAALAAGEETLTELGQNEMEMAFNPTLTEEEIFSRRLNSAVAGGLVGGAFGSLGGLRKPLDTTNEHDLLNPSGAPSQGDMFSGQSWTPVNLPQAEEESPYDPNNRRQMDFLGELDRTLNPDYRPMYPVGMGGTVFQDMPITDDAYRQPRPDLETAPRIDTPVPQDVGSAIALLRSIGDAPVIEGTQLHEAVVAARGILDAHGVKLTLPKLGTNVPKTSTPVAEPATPAEFKSKRQNELWTRALAEVQDDGFLAGINQAITERKYGRAEKLIAQAKEEEAYTLQQAQAAQTAPPVLPGADSGVQPAAPVPSPSPQALSLDRLIPAAGLSSQETQLALVLNDVVNQGGNPAELTNEQIAQRMGLNTQNQVTPIRRRVQKKLEKAARSAGVDLQTALAPKKVAPADESMLGLSPAVQPSVINEEEVFGSIDGDVSPSSGVIASAGGSQANWQDTGSVGDRFIRENNDESIPEFIPAETAQAEEDIQRRVEAEAERARGELMAVLQTPEAEVAGEDWDYMKPKDAPAWEQISDADKAEWVTIYISTKADEEALLAELDAMLPNLEVKNEQSRVVEDRAQPRQGSAAQGRPRLDGPGRESGPGAAGAQGTEAQGGEPSFSRETDGQAERVADEEVQRDDEGAKQNIAYLERNIKQHLGEEAKAEGTYAPARVPEHGLLGQLAAVWGARIQGFKVVGDKGRYGFFSGVYFGGNRDVIYLNETARRPHVALLGHELVHYLRRNNPELFAQFKEQVFQYVKDGEYQAWSKLFAEKGDKLKEEFLGEVVSDGFMNRTFWEAVGRNNPSLLKRVVAIVNKLVNDALAAIGYTPKTKSVVSDFNRVMEIAGEVMAKAGLEMGAVEQARDTPSFSRLERTTNTVAYLKATPAEVEFFRSGEFGTYLNDFLIEKGAAWWRRPDVSLFDGEIVVPIQDVAMMREFAEWLTDAPENRSEIPPQMRDGTFAKALHSAKDTPSFSRNITDQVIDAAPAPAQKAMHTVVDTLEDLSGRTLNYSMFTNDLVEKVSDVLTSAKAWYEGIRNRETLRIAHEAKVDDIANLVDQLPQAKFNRTWGLIKDMTKTGKWGYAPTWRKDVTVDPAMQERYNALDKDEQSVIDAVFKMGDETIRETQAALDALADEIYGEKLATAKDDRTRAKLEKEKGKFKRVFRKDLSVLEGPYAPMRRVGSYVTAAKSARYADLEKQAANGDTKAADELLQLRSDGKHYQVVFSDSLAQARAVERELHAAGFPRHLTSASAKEVFTGEDQLPFQAFEQIRQMALAKGEKGKDVSKLMNLIDELYLTSLADTSARKSELRRTGVEGLNPDTMYKAFLSKGKADAHYLAILKTHQKVSQDFTSMREEARSLGNRADKMDAFNELKLRYENSFNFDPSPLIGRLMNISAMWYLMTKPAYYLYNLTQPLMMAQPYIAQEHGYGAASSAMTKAYNDLLRSQKMLNLTHLDVTKLPEDIRQAMVELRDAGRIDITITQDLGSRLHGGNNKVSKALSKVERALRTATQKTEMVNRIVTAAAAYRLELAKTKDHAAAVEYAKKVVDRTQGDYSNFNAPRLLNATNFRKLITQFRKFQFIQASLLIRMVNDSLRSATPHERAMARKALMFMLGHHAVLAGALGLPLANVVAMAFSMTGGDDEPRDLELWMRRELGDNALADLLMHGVPAVFNVNVSSNVGMGQTFSVVPFADVDMTGAGFKELTFAAMGPVFGLGLKGWEAMGKAQQGDYYGFLTGVLPGAASSSLKSVNEFASGVKNKRGDVLVNPDEISFMDSVVKALGFKTQDDTIRQLVRGQQYEFEQFFKDRTTEVKKAYTEAYRDGDYEEMQALRTRWQEMQEFKREYGFKPQPLSTLLKAPAEQRKREAQTIGGVQYNAGNKGFVSENAAP